MAGLTIIMGNQFSFSMNSVVRYVMALCSVCCKDISSNSMHVIRISSVYGNGSSLPVSCPPNWSISIWYRKIGMLILSNSCTAGLAGLYIIINQETNFVFMLKIWILTRITKI